MAVLQFDDLDRTAAATPGQMPQATLHALRNSTRAEVARRTIPGGIAVVFGTAVVGWLSGHARSEPMLYAIAIVAIACAALARWPLIRALNRDGAACAWRDERWFFVTVMALPLIWGCYSALLLALYPSNWITAAILAFTAAIASNVVITYGMWRALALTYVAVLLLPTTVAGYLVGNALGNSMVFGCIAFAAYLLPQIINMNRFFWASQLTTVELAQRSLELNEAKERAEAASRAKSEFLTCMSHELRTPMNAVLGFAQLIELTADQADEVRRNGREIRDAGAHLMSLIEEILDLSRIEAGQLRIECVAVDLEALAHGVIETLRGAARAGVRLNFEVDGPLPIVRGDALRIRQVLVNLLGNALKFTERGEVVLSLQASGPEHVLMAVRDTGVGIAPEVIDSIFAPFVQGDSSPTRRFSGSGLGLAIAHDLVHLMDGEIEVSSTPGVGSTFRVRLPRHPAVT